MDTYRAIFNSDDTEGVYGISLVSDPAMESLFIALSKHPEQIQFKTVSEEKQILMGAVLIPDKLVYRNQGGREFNVVFPADTIRMASEKFLMNGHQGSSTIEHDADQQLSNVTIVESWIKEDAINDKSAKYGFDEPVGTWYASMKINNSEVWKDYVKTGKVKGFSIDGFFNMEYVKLNKDEMNIENIVMSCLEKVGLKKPEQQEPEQVKLGSVTTAGENPVTINFEGETLTKGSALTMTGAEGNEVPVPDGEYPIEGGQVLVAQGSLASELKEAADPAQKDETPAMMSEPEPAPQIKSEKHTQEVFYQLFKEAMPAVATTIATVIETKMAEMKVELKAELQKEAEPVSLTKVKGEKEIPFEEMTPAQQFRFKKYGKL